MAEQRVSALQKAEAALKAEPAKGLELLLKEWRRTFHPQLSVLIERVGEALAKPVETLPPTQKARGEVLAELARKAPVEQRSGVLKAFKAFAHAARASSVWPSIEVFSEVEEDPRVARMALGLLRDEVLAKSMTPKLWRRLVRCLERHGDVGMLSEARTHQQELAKSRIGGSLEERFKNVLEKLEATRAPMELPDAALLEGLLAAWPEHTVVLPARDAASEDAMLRAILQAPDDDGPRLVYADHLTERNDVRGELIALQVARARTKVTAAAKKREAELMREHRKQLLEPFSGCVQVTGLKYERGFIAELKARAPLPVHPLTRLFRSVDFSGCALPAGIALDALETAAGLPHASLKALWKAAPRLERYTDRQGGWLEDWQKHLAGVPEGVGLALAVSGRADQVLAQVLSQPWGAQVKALVANGDRTPAVAPPELWAKALKKIGPGLERVQFALLRASWLLERGEAGWELTIDRRYVWELAQQGRAADWVKAFDEALGGLASVKVASRGSLDTTAAEIEQAVPRLAGKVGPRRL